MTVETPCINVCVMDPVRALCRGCGRTLAEIGAWSMLADPERRAIMAALPRRMRDAGLETPAAPASPDT